MSRLTAATALLLAVVLLSACGGDSGGDAGAPIGEETPIPVEPDGGIGEGAGAGEGAGDTQEVTGTFGGDAQLEGGCAWIDGDDGTRYEVQYPAGYEVRMDPLELVDPDGEVVAGEGDTLTVRGRVEPEGMSFCQVGTIFTADDVTA